MSDGYRLRYGEQRDNVTCIPNELWDHYLPHIGGLGVLVYTFLYRITSSRTKVDLEYMASELNIHFDDVQKAVAALIEIELLTFSGAQNNIMKINDPKDADSLQRMLKGREEQAASVRRRRNKEVEAENLYATADIYELVEKEYGRPLKTAEYRSLSALEKEHPRELLLEAISRSVINQAFSLSYVQGILHNWQLKGIRTLEDVAREDRKFKGKTKSKKSSKQTATEKQKAVPDYYDIYAQREAESKKKE